MKDSLIRRPPRPSASHRIQCRTIKVLEVMPQMIRQRSRPSKHGAAEDEVSGRQVRVFEDRGRARAEREEGYAANVRRHFEVSSTMHQPPTQGESRIRDQVCAAWASTTSAEARICGLGRHERLPWVVGVVTDALPAILESFYGYTCKMVSTYVAEKKQETGN
jgi:hypothetical protein